MKNNPKIVTPVWFLFSSGTSRQTMDGGVGDGKMKMAMEKRKREREREKKYEMMRRKEETRWL